MPLIKRRHFVQSLGTSLTFLGVSQLKIQSASLLYGQVLAQDTHRKRALLVGINKYPGDSTSKGLWHELHGAVTDVALQQELLIHRFGFQPDDILVLTDEKATRENILKQFEQFLIPWVKSPDDVVVFHYSGHGSTVIDPNHIFDDGLNGTIVPFDAVLPSGFPYTGGPVDDITAGTIFLLREALARKTKNVTFILDSCYSGAGVRGNLIIRSRPGYAEMLLRGDNPTTKLESNPAELEYQHRWLTDLKLSPTTWVENRKHNRVGGAAIFAAARNQPAADATFAQNLYAGVFTYALTRQLWQQTSNQGMGKVILSVKAKTEQFLHSSLQTPGIDSGDEQQPMYFTPIQKPAAEAVITQVQGDAVKLLLTGAEPQALEALGRGAIFNVVDNRGQLQGTVKIQSRDRLNAMGLLQPKSGVKITAGTVLQERSRAIPSDLKLRIGLDKSLEQFGDVQVAKQTLQSLPRVEVVPLLVQEVHYILGRMLLVYRQDLEKRKIVDLPVVNSIGLFSVGLDPIPGSFGRTDEPIQEAVNRLLPKLRLLLAARLMKMTLNTNSSRLNIVARLTADNQSLLGESFTVRGGSNPRSPNPAPGSFAQIEINKSVQISVENREHRDLYIAVLIFSPDGDIDIPFPLGDGNNAALVPAGQRPSVPRLSFVKPLGIAELLVVASTTPIDNAVKAIQSFISEQRNGNRGSSEVVEKAENAIASLLDDLAGSRGGTNTDIPLFDTQQMAALSITFAIVDQK